MCKSNDEECLSEQKWPDSQEQDQHQSFTVGIRDAWRSAKTGCHSEPQAEKPELRSFNLDDLLNDDIYVHAKQLEQTEIWYNSSTMKSDKRSN